LRRVEYVGPQVGKELRPMALKALMVVIIGIMIYLAMRFEWRYAVSAIIANLHDVVIILGFFAAFQWEFSLPVLAAVLAVLGYSVNESVVVFDRVRESVPQCPQAHADGARGNGQCDHQHHFAHHHHARLDPDDGAVDAAVRRRGAALLRGRADHRHLFRHLLIGAGRLPAGDVAGRPGSFFRFSANFAPPHPFRLTTIPTTIPTTAQVNVVVITAVQPACSGPTKEDQAALARPPARNPKTQPNMAPRPMAPRRPSSPQQCGQ
jgi:hypothetical protein